MRLLLFALCFFITLALHSQKPGDNSIIIRSKNSLLPALKKALINAGFVIDTTASQKAVMHTKPKRLTDHLMIRILMIEEPDDGVFLAAYTNPPNDIYKRYRVRNTSKKESSMYQAWRILVNVAQALKMNLIFENEIVEGEL